MSGLYLEDFEVGDTFETARRTVTEADVVAFAGLSGDYNALHTDQQFAETTVHGARIAHGLLVLSITSGLSNQTRMFEGTAIGFVGFQDWNFRAPVYFGDTVRMRITIESKRRTSKGDRGIVVRRLEVLNQRDEVVQDGATLTMVLAREKREPDPRPADEGATR